MKNLDTTKILKRLIIVSWVTLGCCFLIKLLGGNLFEIVCNNQRFITICNYADSHIWCRCIISSIISVINSYFIILAMCGKTKFSKWELLIVIVGNVFSSCFKLLISREIGVAFDIINAIIVPIIFVRKRPKRILLVFIGNIMLIAFQMISMFTKNIGMKFITLDGLLIGLIFSIDVFIMVILYYLYSNLISKGDKKMSELFWWFQKDQVKSLENQKAKLLNKRVDIDNEIREIDEKIEKLKSENKG